MTAHTPGPWFTKAYVDERFIEIKANEGYSLVATVHFNSGDRDANARLIAAAPTMHEEMQRFLEVIERAEADSEVWTRLTAGTGIATANAYRAAIAKAKGESA